MKTEDEIMVLSSDSLELLVEKCSDNKGFTGAVLFNNRQDKDDFLIAMKEAGATWSVNRKLRRIYFKKTGSFIIVYVVDSDCASIYSGYDIPYSDYNMILVADERLKSRVEMVPYYDKVTVNENISKELDKFLKGFEIAKNHL